MHLRQIDMNLLVIFESISRLRSVSKAANELYISQSACSHSLRRMRSLFDDQLFVSTPQGMEPTPRASRLSHELPELLSSIERCINASSDFIPQNSIKTFVIYASQHFEMVLLPQLVRQIQERAPQCQVLVYPLTQDIPEKELKNGNVDLVIGFTGYINDNCRLSQEVLIEDRLVCVIDKNNSFIGNSINLEQFLSLKHIYPSPWGSKDNMVDSWLTQQKVSRDIEIQVQNYSAVPGLIIGSKNICCLPERIANIFSEYYPLRIIEGPKGLPHFSLNLLWHPIYETQPSTIWLRKQLVEASESRLLKEREGK